MARLQRTSVTWTLGQSLSSWTWFGAHAPNTLVLPAGMDGARLAFVGADSGADGEAAVGTAQDLLDLAAAKVTVAVPAAGGRLVFLPDALRGQGWIALRSETAGGVAQTQSAARAAVWQRVTD